MCAVVAQVLAKFIRQGPASLQMVADEERAYAHAEEALRQKHHPPPHSEL